MSIQNLSGFNRRGICAYEYNLVLIGAGASVSGKESCDSKLADGSAESPNSSI